MTSWLSDAEWAEEVRAAAVCSGGPNAKLYQAEIGAEQADLLRKRQKEDELFCPLGRRVVDVPMKTGFRCDDPEGDWIEEQQRKYRAAELEELRNDPEREEPTEDG